MEKLIGSPSSPQNSICQLLKMDEENKLKMSKNEQSQKATLLKNIVREVNLMKNLEI